MLEVVVGEPTIARSEQETVVTVEVLVPHSDPREVRFVLPPVEVHPQQVTDAMFVVGRLVAMKGGWPLVLPGPVSARLLAGAETHQDVFLEWFPRTVKPIPLDYEVADPLALPSGRGVLSTFSGGVDSYFTVLENQPKLSGVLFVHGLDIGLHHEEFRTQVRSELVASAEDLGLPLWEVVTDVRALTDPYAKWGPKAHGAILSGVAILLAQRVETFLLPGSVTRGATQGQGWGSHVLIDRLNSTDYLSVVHHGVDTPRPEKTARIVESEEALRHLRVCYTSREHYNCGRCSKCRRTQIDLDLAGFTDTAQIFAETVPIETALADFEVTGMIPRAFAEDSIARANALGRRDVAVGLRRAIKRYEARQLAPEVVRLRRYLKKHEEVREAFAPRRRTASKSPQESPQKSLQTPPPPPTLRAVLVHRLPASVRRPLRRLRAVAPPRR